ncbi:MAG: PD-(D/E)XK nuclease family transposase, partial [Lachnospiraceae bacterium]|nr:PD-(D/E)XK nuclease family transposase [Lachnospiraceae bacterium]
MGDEQSSRMKIIKQGAEEIRNSNLLSDTFATIALEDIDACQYVIRKILGMDDLKIVEVKGQYRLLNMTAKDAILDAFAQDSTGRLINVEIQRRDTVDHARRTRYYGSMIDKGSLDKGVEYEELPDVYIIYISETDIWKAGKTVYQVNKTLGETGIPYDDGSHVIFVNAAVDDGSEIAKMMQYFKTADPDDMSQGELSKRVNFLKSEKGGYETMCEAAEKIYNQGREQEKKNTARKLQQKGNTIADIADLLEVSEKQVEEWL